MSGLSLDGVRVHYNSSQPATLQAHAYTRGQDIHVAPGQEQHVPHELGHVVQQMQGRVPVTGQVGGMALNDDTSLEAEADRLGATATQMRAIHTRQPAQLRSHLLGSSALMPVQRFSWKEALTSLGVSWEEALKTLGVGGAVGAGLALSGAVGIPAAIGLGVAAATSTAATKVGGVGAGLGAGTLGTGGALAGTAIGTALGGPVVGAVSGGLLGTIGSVLGGTIGADIQSARTDYNIHHDKENIPEVWKTVITRAYEGIGENDTVQSVINKIDSTGLRNNLQERVNNNLITNDKAKFHKGTIEIFVEQYLDGRISPLYNKQNPENDEQVKTKIRGALYANPFISSILKGTAFGPNGGNVGNQSLTVNNADQHPMAAAAQHTFNALVQRPGLPDVGGVEQGSSSISYMSDDGNLTIGWGATTGVLVHELGHHLENNLPPVEFGTLHNFLRARSKDTRMRRVGKEYMMNKEQPDRGYDTTTPPVDVGGHLSLTRLAVDGLSARTGIGNGPHRIDRFVQQMSHDPRSSYATKVYDDTYHTEFLATTIHLMANPETAATLIEADPLRVCLFLYFANRPAYNQVKNALQKPGKKAQKKRGKKAPQKPINLDNLIHRL
ncbi:DUF4157 domain-containing protein [Niveispirillum sp. SYP-B3756]|uniref:eCIS core domain-containing protein n=1 Tax=Niveispirillum sp. SYP-B3756 TaxID=2662178 RepID=UPI001B3B4AD6|nr:DUF4157 domain-containing protein [Niveispirillum sp. SYP-B3756]